MGRVSYECTYALEFPSRGCDNGTGNRNCSTSILDEATIFLRRERKKERKGNINETSVAETQARAGRKGKESDAVDERYSSISMSECVVRAETKFSRLEVAKREFGERAVERGRKNKYVPEPGSDG